MSRSLRSRCLWWTSLTLHLCPPLLAELQRGDSLLERQVKEARSRCRSIASLLTHAPDPHSKGVLMFKKRRQRAKKYTLTCFGKAGGGGGGGTEGEAGGETEEDGGGCVQSSSEGEDAGSSDPTWDTGYLHLLEQRSSACPSATLTALTTANHSPRIDAPAGPHQSPASEGSANQSSSLEQPISSQMPPLTNGESVAVSRASVVLSPPPRNPGPAPGIDPDYLSFSPNQNLLNRTARPFTSGATPPRPTVTSVMFRPPQPKPAVAVSMVTIQPAPRAVSSTSLFIPSRSSATPTPTPTHPSINAPPSALPQPASLPFSPFPHPPICPPQPAAPPPTPFSPCAPSPPPLSLSSRPAPAPPTSASNVSLHPQPFAAPPPPTHPCIPPTGAIPPAPPAAMATAPLQPDAADAVAARERRIAVPAARTGILSEARRRGNKKPMFSAVQMQDVSPNPDLMSMVHNMDGHFGRAAAAEPGAEHCGEAGPEAGPEAGHESGPEEDWLRLGAEACNFLQAQRGPGPPPVAPKPQTPALGGRGGQLFARRQSRMDRYVVERASSAAIGHTREPSPTPSLPATWKYSPNIRAPPPISYNPLLSPSCPLQAQKKPHPAGSKGHKAPRWVGVLSHQPYQLNSALFSYGGGAPPTTPPQPQRGTGGAPQKTARVCEIRRFSTPPPPTTGPALKVLAPRSATSMGDHLSAYPTPRPHWASSPLSPPAPPAPSAPLPQVPSFTSPAPHPAQPPPFSCSLQTNKPFKSAPDLRPHRPGSTASVPVPRPRFSTSSLGLQASVWRPGSTLVSD